MKKNKIVIPKLVFYSGGQDRANNRLHEAMMRLVNKRNPAMTYIPFCSDGSEIYFKRAVRRYQNFGVSRFHCLHVDKPIKPHEITRAMRGDIIYLAGGNTFYFLHHLRRSGLLPKLKRFAERGGVLAGLSAGGLIMTPNIYLASYPLFDADENEVKLKNLKSLGLVQFEFYPHYVNSKRVNEAMCRYSRRINYPIFAARDGSGIVVHGDRTEFLGEVVVFSQGQKLNFYQG